MLNVRTATLLGSAILWAPAALAQTTQAPDAQGPIVAPAPLPAIPELPPQPTEPLPLPPPPAAAVTPPPAPTPPAEPAQVPLKVAPESYVPLDLAPTLEVFRRGERFLVIGALVQVLTIPYLGDEALMDNGDPGNREGFRLRRARVGMEGGILRDVTASIELDATAEGDESLIESARLRYSPCEAFSASIGSAKVPYSRSALDSASRLRFIERPLGTGDLALGGRLGAAVEGRFLGGWIGYVAGVYNATRGLTNESDGLLYGGRLESAPLGAAARLRPGPVRVIFGGGALQEDGATVDTFAASGDAHAEYRGARLRGEVLYDQRTPDAEPELPPTIPGKVKRIVAVGEATMFVWRELLEAAIRYEWYDNNRGFEDFGDQQLITGGFNVYLLGHHLKAQLNYIHRDERKGRDIKNDAALVSVTGIL